MGKEEVERFLSHLTVEKDVAASTQNQALSALLFLYRDVLGIKLDWLDGVVRAKRPKLLPVVLSRDEVNAVLRHLSGTNLITAMLMYGAGLRLLECLTLRVKDIDFGYRQITVREGKGNKDRVTVLPVSVEPRLKLHLEDVRIRFEKDLKEGYGYVRLPNELGRKFPNATTHGDGNGCFPGIGTIWIPNPEFGVGTTWTNPSFSGPSKKQWLWPASKNMAPATHSVTLSPPICSRTDTTSGRFRSCLVTGM
jgi:integrase